MRPSHLGLHGKEMAGELYLRRCSEHCDAVDELDIDAGLIKCILDVKR
jgi:hypothetical protein